MGVDAAGNAYFADGHDNVIWMLPAASGTHFGITMTAGNIYIISGSTAGSSGFSGDGGPATSAVLNGPGELTVDSPGNVYVQDGNNTRIRMLVASWELIRAEPHCREYLYHHRERDGGRDRGWSSGFECRDQLA